MKTGHKYAATGLPEAQFEPGSHGRVLRNLRGIVSKREMDRVETEEQARALDELIDTFDATHRFTERDLREIHRVWLGTVYAWAGRYRTVNVSKDDFTFAAANHIPKLMADFETEVLAHFTPCRVGTTEEIVRALAIVHTELVLIHPFREGNGRVARLLSTLMALQTGLPALNFEDIRGAKREEYFAAVRSGLDRNYGPMETIFSVVVGRTCR